MQDYTKLKNENRNNVTDAELKNILDSVVFDWESSKQNVEWKYFPNIDLIAMDRRLSILRSSTIFFSVFLIVILLILYFNKALTASISMYMIAFVIFLSILEIIVYTKLFNRMKQNMISATIYSIDRTKKILTINKNNNVSQFNYGDSIKIASFRLPADDESYRIIKENIETKITQETGFNFQELAN